MVGLDGPATVLAPAVEAIEWTARGRTDRVRSAMSAVSGSVAECQPLETSGAASGR
jgi:hypothetical protein